jgi:hypothetical protein
MLVLYVVIDLLLLQLAPQSIVEWALASFTNSLQSWQNWFRLHIYMWSTSSSTANGIRGRAVGFWTDMFYSMRRLASCVNPYQEDKGVFCRGPIPLVPVVLNTAAGQQRRFRPAPSILFPRYPPPTYVGVKHSPISHLGAHPMGDRQLHTGVIDQ